MRLLRPAGIVLAIVAGIEAHAQTFQGLDLSPKKKAKTELVVTLNPPVPGARLFIDKEPAGELPLEPKALAAGAHTLTIERPGYRTIEEKVTLARGRKNEVNLSLEPVGAAVWVEANQPGAVCSFDGGEPEALPLVKVLAPGGHELRIGKPGFTTRTRTIDAELGVDVKVVAELDAAAAGSADRPVQANLEPPERDSDLDQLDRGAPAVPLGAQASQSTPIYKRWYVWVAAGAIVAGAVAGAVVATQPRRPSLEPTAVCGGPCDATIGLP